MKSHITIAAGVMAIALSCSLAWASDPAIVFVDGAKAGAKSIMVMDTDGSNRTEIFRTRKRFCDCGGPQLSPSISPDGQQVAFVLAEDTGYDVRKISTNGGNSEVLFCGHRPEGNVVPEAPQWSPDGTEIAAILFDFSQPKAWIVILPKDGISCGELPNEMLDLPPLADGVFTWSSDGSQFAFLGGFENGGGYLSIMDRADPSNVDNYRIVWPSGLPEGHGPESLDWQRGPDSREFALHTFSDEVKEEIVWRLTVDEGSDPPVAVTTAVAEGQSPTWSPDDSQLLFGGSQTYWGSGVLTRVTIATGGTEVLGSGYDPDWRRITPECVEDDDCGTGDICCGGSCVAPISCSPGGCNDGDPCTNDYCDPCLGCTNTTIPGCGFSCSDYVDQQTCSADSACRWHKRKGCVSR